MADNGTMIREINQEEMEVFGNKGVINPEKRVLIIGLGGTGTDALLITKNAILNRFKLQDGKVPGNIELLAVDTDRNILQKRVGSARIDENDLVLLSDPMIEQNFNHKSELPEYITDWLNPTLSAPKVAGQVGAGGIRQVGRYLLIQNYAEVIRKIQERLHQIMINAPQGSMIDIIILSGISGGTGSGTFIDMGYIVRKACLNEGITQPSYKQITAYLFMPDANIGNPKVPNDAKAFMQVNGYAAMKDLDYFMGITEKHTISSGAKAEKTYKFRQRYGFAQNEVIESEEAPFDSAYLIAGQASVLSPVADAYEYAINIAADSIVNFIAGSTVKGHSVATNGMQTLASVDINGAAMKAMNPNFIRSDGTKQIGVYDYKIIGASMATLPMQEITNYIAGQFLQRVDVLKHQLPNGDNFNAFYKAIGLNTVETHILDKLPKLAAGCTGADLKSNPANNGPMIQILKGQVDTARKNIPTIVDQELSTLETKIMTQIENYFTNIAQGPFYANHIMADVEQGIIVRLKNIAMKLNQRETGYTQQAKKLENDAKAKKSEAENARTGRARKYQEYIDLCVEQAEQQIKAEVCKVLSAKIDSAQALDNPTLVDKISTKNREVFNTYSTILEALAERFSGGGNVNVSRTGRTFMWNIVSINDVSNTVKNAIPDTLLKQQMNNMLQDMIRESKKWSSEGDVLQQFGAFISDAFAGVLSFSMDQYMAKFSDDDLKQMIERLDSSAEERFPADVQTVKQKKTISNQVTAPTDAPRMQNIIKGYLEGKGILAPPQTSLLCERISWTRVSIGVPMFRYAFLPMYEQAYQEVPANNRNGMHLYENKGVCGWDYPALLPKMLYQSNYKNEEEKERTDRFKEVFDKADKFGLVQCEAHQNAAMKVSHEDWCAKKAAEILQKHNIDRNDIYGSIQSIGQITRCKNELSTILSDMDNLADFHYIYLPDTQDNSIERSKAYAREEFCRMPEALEPVKNEIAKIERLSEIIAELDKISEAFGTDKSDYMMFIHAFIFDVIKQTGKNYYYKSGDEDVEIAKSYDNPTWRYEAYGKFKRNFFEDEEENISNMFDEAMNSAEGIGRVKADLEKTLENIIKKEIPALDELSHDDPNYAAANEFYKKLKVFIKNELKTL